MAIGHVSILNKSSCCSDHLGSSAPGVVDYGEEIGTTAKCAIRVKSYKLSCQFDIFEFIADGNILLWSINTSVCVSYQMVFDMAARSACDSCGPQTPHGYYTHESRLRTTECSN